MSRLDLIRDATRPKLSARALFQGPQGSGKTWTALNVARLLTRDVGGRVLGIDTERESMLTYADVYKFKHLPWRPPYDPGELIQVLDAIATRGVPALDLSPFGADDVVVIDSFSHFWQGTGGILDIANGRVQGGWDKARPIQNQLVDQLLAIPCHVLLCARMKNSVLVSDNGKTIENVGLTIVQDDNLGYELNVVIQMDMQHNATVMKSRTPAVPVGRMYPGGHEEKLAADYAEWLAGGIPPANREDVERIVGLFAGISDTTQRAHIKNEFVKAFGMPHSLTADQVPAAYQFLAKHGAAVGEGPAAASQTPQDAPAAATPPPAASEAPVGDAAPASGASVPGLVAQLESSLQKARDAQAAQQAAADDPLAQDHPSETPADPDGELDHDAGPEMPDADPEQMATTHDDAEVARAAAAVAHVKAMKKPELVNALNERKLATNGNMDTLGYRLVQALLAEGWQPAQATLV